MVEKSCKTYIYFLHYSGEFEYVAFGKLKLISINILLLSSDICNYFADEDAPSKVAKVEIPTTPLGGGVVPGSLGIAYRPQSTLGLMQPMYVFY